jgi:uncharacterized protein YndB with AHSA1/START domain
MPAEGPLVTVTRHFAASPERVFNAWVDPQLIRAWMGSFPGDEIVSVSVDARVGGRFSFVVRRAGQLLDHNGRYLEMQRPDRLAFTWGVNEDGVSEVRLEFAAAGDGTELTLVHRLDPQWAEFAERTAEGWTRISAAVEQSLGTP